ncbi:hypothetical protein BST20_09315 [Mycobacterium branderi]|uniref:DUF4189 domain-containing protein n=1 Tax=Mycobacterium branderi TaxID=43348 RepID=A0AA91RIV6_9MYCO|nr:hypothetical protein BST20_09315 [Mycobacterium branderi]
MVVAKAVAVGPVAHADGTYGAIYARPGGPNWAISLGQPTPAKAEDRAMVSCNHIACDKKLAFTDCGALAQRGFDYYAASGPTQPAAESAALAGLPDSSIATSGCNGSSPREENFRS